MEMWNNSVSSVAVPDKLPAETSAGEPEREREGNEKLKQKIRIKKEAEMSEQILTRVFDQGNWRFSDEISVPPVHLLMRTIYLLQGASVLVPLKKMIIIDRVLSALNKVRNQRIY